MTPVCEGEFVRNGDFETGYSTFWDNYGKLEFNIVDNPLGGKAIEMKDKPDLLRSFYGLKQRLYVDKSCLNMGDRYQITAKFRMKNAEGADIVCDPHANYQDLLFCGKARLEFYSTLHVDGINLVPVAHDAAVGVENGGWSILAGAYALNEGDVQHTKVELRLVDTHPDVTVIYDDISMKKIHNTCDQMILNPAFEDGTSSFWRPSYQRNTNYSIIPNTPSSMNDYALLFNRGEGRNWEYMTQDLDTRCFGKEGDELRITAKIKLVDANDVTKALACDTYEWNKIKETFCPTVTFRAFNCDNDWQGEFDLRNQLHDQWSTTDYNNFQYDIVLDSKLVSCQNFRIGLGRYTPVGRSLVVSEIKFGTKPVLPPVDTPTYSPVALDTSIPTAAPTPRPISTATKSCPPVGLYETIGAGSTVLIRSSASNLCTLTKVILDDMNSSIKNSVPIARSYGQHDWEVSAGELASNIFEHGGITCRTTGCQVDLPLISSNEQYRLTSFAKSLSDHDIMARFLETATFGILKEDLDGANGQNEQIISWIKTQMDKTSTPMTGHRSFWRERTSPRVSYKNDRRTLTTAFLCINIGAYHSF